MAGDLTVGALREVLAGFDDEAVVVLASDAEGNRLTPMPASDGVGVGVWVAGEFWDEDEADRPAGGIPAVSLWPQS